MRQENTPRIQPPDHGWLIFSGLRLAARAGLADGRTPGAAHTNVSVPVGDIIEACALLNNEDRARLRSLASQHMDPEEIATWLMAPATRDHALLNHALFPQQGQTAVARTEMQYDWDRGSLIKEKTGPVLAIFAVAATLLESGAILVAKGPLHLQGAAGVLASTASAATITWLASRAIGGLFRTHPSTSEKGGQSVWRAKIDTLARLCQQGRFTEAERRRIADGAAAFSSADRLLVQHLPATDFARFMLADDTTRAAILEASPPPALNRIAASWHNPETRLAIGRLGFGKGLLASRLGAVAVRRQAIETLRANRPQRVTV